MFLKLIKKIRGVIPPILTWNVFNQNYVNDVIMVEWIPSAELKAKARIVNG